MVLLSPTEACPGDDDSNTAVSDLLQSSQYLDMFNDKARNKAYSIAIESTVQSGGSPLMKRYSGIKNGLHRAERHMADHT